MVLGGVSVIKQLPDHTLLDPQNILCFNVHNAYSQLQSRTADSCGAENTTLECVVKSKPCIRKCRSTHHILVFVAYVTFQ
jgi:hypothetical protein